MNVLVDKLGGRKCFLVLLIFAMSSLLLITTKFSNADFMEICKVLIVVYPISNVGQELLLSNYPPGTSKEQVQEELGRKFGLTLVMFISFSVFTFLNFVTYSMYVEFSTWLITAYMSSNVIGKAIDNGLSIKFK